MTRLFAFPLALVLLIPSLASAESFALKFGGMPNNGIPCPQMAAHITEGFKKGSGVLLARAQCTQDRGATYDIVLYYTADLPADPISTVEYRAGGPSPAEGQGNYDTAKDCQRALHGQFTLFRAQTALEPVVAYCYREKDPSRHPFVVRIDAFGTPRSPLFLLSRTLYGDTLEAPDTLEARLASYARARLPNLAALSLRQVYSGSYILRTNYYGDKDANVEVARIGEFRWGGGCERARRLAEAGLARIASPPPLFCLRDRSLVRDSLEMYQVRRDTYLEPISYPRSYANITECEADETAAMREVTQSLGIPAIAAVCIGDTTYAGMRVFVQKASPPPPPQQQP
jgi:hypothetical protein